MKTAKEWLLEVEHRVGGLWESDVKGIQADALRHAAMMLRHDGVLELTPASLRLQWAKKLEKAANKLHQK